MITSVIVFSAYVAFNFGVRFASHVAFPGMWLTAQIWPEGIHTGGGLLFTAAGAFAPALAWGITFAIIFIPVYALLQLWSALAPAVTGH